MEKAILMANIIDVFRKNFEKFFSFATFSVRGTFFGELGH